jgi:hypothetical protein
MVQLRSRSSATEYAAEGPILRLTEDHQLLRWPPLIHHGSNSLHTSIATAGAAKQLISLEL